MGGSSVCRVEMAPPPPNPSMTTTAPLADPALFECCCCCMYCASAAEMGLLYRLPTLPFCWRATLPPEKRLMWWCGEGELVLDRKLQMGIRYLFSLPPVEGHLVSKITSF